MSDALAYSIPQNNSAQIKGQVTVNKNPTVQENTKNPTPKKDGPPDDEKEEQKPLINTWISKKQEEQQQESQRTRKRQDSKER